MTGAAAGVRIREFAAADLAAATALWEAAGDSVAPAPPDEIEAKLRRDPHLFLVAESATGELVGVVMGSTDGRRGWISRLAVAAPYRRRGVGRALVSEVERRLLAMDVPQVNLMVYRGAAQAARFWTSLGYLAFEDAVVHTRRLDGAEVVPPHGSRPPEPC